AGLDQLVGTAARGDAGSGEKHVQTHLASSTSLIFSVRMGAEFTDTIESGRRFGGPAREHVQRRSPAPESQRSKLNRERWATCAGNAPPRDGLARAPGRSRP